MGEEGAGDLRGARHLCLKGPYAGRISHFVAVEPGWNRVTNGATGSKRYRVAFTGPGGHSFFAFGTPNPAYALGRLLVGISQLEVPTTPLTTFSVGVVRGGTSVNAIPERVEVDVDLRSYSDAALTALEQRFLGLPESAAKSKLDNRDGSQKSGIGVELTLIGDRPAGETSADASLVQIAAAALVAEEIEPRIGFDSSDANVPISLGIPAITIGSGFRAFRYHSLDEFIVACRPDVLATMRASLTILIAAANLEDEK